MSKLLFINLKIIISFLFILFKHYHSTISIPKYLSSNIIEEIRGLLFLLPEDKIIPFNNSLINITLYNTSDISFSYDKMNINFENCLTILQKVYDLDPFFDYTHNDNNEIKRSFFIIVKIELDRKLIKYRNITFMNNSNITNDFHMDFQNNINNNIINNSINNNITKRPTNHIEYLIFDGKNGLLLNTSYCNDLNVKISHPIVDKNGIDLNISKKLYEEYKIDVYRTNDSFFNDFCMNYTSDKNTDLTIGQRRSYFYQNVSFCDSNCTYIQVNYTSNTAICACVVKDTIMNDALLSGGEDYKYHEFTYNEVESIINYKIILCYKEVFNLVRLKINVGSYVSIIIIFFYTVCVIHFRFNRKRNVMSFFQKIKLKIEENKNNENCENCDNQGKNENFHKIENENNNIINQYDNDNVCDLYDNDKINKSNKTKIININGIIITDIANPNKKKKMKVSIDNGNNIEYNLKPNNSITKDTSTQIRNYGDIKLDTGDELLNKKNEEKFWGGIISLKRKNSKNGQKKPKKEKEKHIPLTSGKSSSILTSTKNNTVKSDERKLDGSFTKTINENNHYNLINLFPSSNYSVEIPISNIMPSFLKPKKILKSVPHNNNISDNKDLTCSQFSQNHFILKKMKTKCSNAIYNNFVNKNDIINEADYDNNENNINNNNCFVIEDCSNINNYTLRRTKEIIYKKKSKDKKNNKNYKDIKKYSKNSNLFVEFDDMKFEIAILIDNRNFFEKFCCEIKDNCIIIILFFRNDVLFKQVRLSSFILSCTLDYFFNAFFYSEIYLKQRYEEDKLITILLDYPKEIFATLSSQFIVKLVELLMEDKALSLFLKRIAAQNKYYLKGINYLLKRYEKKFYIYITVSYFILIITWYYTTAFCTVYQNSQMKLLYDTLESLALNLILPFPISFLSMSFRHLAIKKLNKFLFIISKIVRIFA